MSPPISKSSLKFLGILSLLEYLPEVLNELQNGRNWLVTVYLYLSHFVKLVTFIAFRLVSQATLRRVEPRAMAAEEMR